MILVEIGRAVIFVGRQPPALPADRNLHRIPHEVLALAHLGRHNLEQGGGHKIIAHLSHHYHSNPAKLRITLTPAAGKNEYKIWALENIGMKEATFEQLASAGVLQANIIDAPIETTSSADYYSYSEFLKGNRDEDGDHAIVAMMTE